MSLAIGSGWQISGGWIFDTGAPAGSFLITISGNFITTLSGDNIITQ
jgi:hypothetical protein